MSDYAATKARVLDNHAKLVAMADEGLTRARRWERLSVSFLAASTASAGALTLIGQHLLAVIGVAVALEWIWLTNYWRGSVEYWSERQVANDRMKAVIDKLP